MLNLQSLGYVIYCGSRWSRGCLEFDFRFEGSVVGMLVCVLGAGFSGLWFQLWALLWGGVLNEWQQYFCFGPKLQALPVAEKARRPSMRMNSSFALAGEYFSTAAAWKPCN